MINFAGNKDREMFSKKNSESSIDRGDNIRMKAINKSSF
jgi:DNA-directed RNA polymerase subunit E'/Rpb7